MSLDFSVFWENRGPLIVATLVTLRLWAIAFVVSLLAGFIMALVRTYGPRPLRAFLSGTIYVARAFPALLLVFIVFFGLPFIGLRLSSFMSVAITLTLIQTVYVTEVFRSALFAIEKGQFDAGYALGLRPMDVMWRVILPQAAVIAAPAYISSAVQLMHNTTFASAVALLDLLGQARNIAVNTLEASPILIVSVVYLAMLLPLVRLGRRLEARLALTRQEAR